MARRRERKERCVQVRCELSWGAGGADRGGRRGLQGALGRSSGRDPGGRGKKRRGGRSHVKGPSEKRQGGVEFDLRPEGLR